MFTLRTPALAAWLALPCALLRAVACVLLPAATLGAAPAPRSAEFPFEEDPVRAREDIAALLEELLAEAQPGAPEWPAAGDERSALRERLRTAVAGALGVPRRPGGGLPTGRATGRIELASHSIVRLALERKDAPPIPALLYRPNPPSAVPAPAILHLHGHWPGGKSSPRVQLSCQSLVQRGFVVLAIDLDGFGELESTGHGRVFEAPAAGTSLLGGWLTDARDALAFLAAVPGVDAERLGVVGASGGGLLGAALMALDERVAAAGLVAFLHDDSSTLRAGQCACNYVPGLLRVTSTATLAALAAPRPLLVVLGVQDDVLPVRGARSAAARMRAAWAVEGADGRFAVAEVVEAHDHGRAAREAVATFLLRELGGRPDGPPATDADVTLGILSPETLSALDGRGATRAPLNARLAARQRELSTQSTRLSQAALAACLAVGPAEALCAVEFETIVDGGLRRTRLELRRPSGPTLRAVLIEPLDLAPSAPTWLWLDPRGARLACEDGGPSALARLGQRVLAADLRAQGEHPGGRQDLVLFEVGLLSARPLLGQRVTDAGAWLAEARARSGGGPVSVFGAGESGIIGLSLAALGHELDGLVLAGSPASWRSEPSSDSTWRLPLTLVVPGLTDRADIADLAALSRVPKLWLAPRGRAGAPLPTSAIRTLTAKDGASSVEELPASLSARLEQFARAAGLSAPAR